ncbi:ribosomal protein S2, flavodoxin-like domain-containing protein, partial [Blastocladiella britannica]
ASELSTADLIAANTHVGHAPSRWTASNTPYILGTRSGLHIIDPNQSLAHLRRAAHFVRRVSANGGIVLFVGHAPDARPLAADAAVHAGQYYVHDWVPGTLTNTDQVVVARQAPFDRDGSLPAQAPKPDVLVILDITSKPSLRAVKEARKLNIPTIAVVDTDVDARWVTYPVPANDDSAESLALVARALAQAAADG